MFYLLYIIKKLTEEIDELENGPKVSEAQRKLWQERDMAKWKAWKAKQEKEKNKI